MYRYYKGDQLVYKKRKIKKKKKNQSNECTNKQLFSVHYSNERESSSHPHRIFYYSNKLKAEILIKGGSNYFLQKSSRLLL